MQDLTRASTALLLTLALAAPPLAVAQAPAEPVAAEGGGALRGSFEGWAKLANDWPGLSCQYDAGADAVSVRLELAGEAGRAGGSVAIDIAPAAGSGCPPLRKRYTISEVAEAPGTITFTDSGGNEWTLAARRQGAVLQGLMAWRQGAVDQPLAEDFKMRNGQRPLARLSGEVRLRRAGERTPGPAGTTGQATTAAAAAPPSKKGAGTHVKNLGIVIGANVVGLGLVYGANRLGKGSAGGGVVTCSPRVCTVGAPNQPCYCENNVMYGASCGETKTGLQAGETGCDGRARPCQAGLSCNSGRCEDPASGRCI